MEIRQEIHQQVDLLIQCVNFIAQVGYQLKLGHSDGARSQESESGFCMTSDFCIPYLPDCPALSWSPTGAY